MATTDSSLEPSGVTAANGASPSDDVLYDRMVASLLASWTRYAEGSAKASIEEVPGATVAVFPAGPERTVYNNALLARRLDQPRAAEALAARWMAVTSTSSSPGSKARSWRRPSPMTTTATEASTTWGLSHTPGGAVSAQR